MPSPSPHTVLQGARVLVVDDDASVRVLLSAMLQMVGCDPLNAASAEEASEILDGPPIDAVLLDVHLPGASGHAFLRTLRADPRHALLPVVMLTGSMTREDRLQAAAAGVSVYLIKPIDSEELGLRLSSLLVHKRIVDRLEEGGRVMVTLARTLEARDHYTAGHSERVAMLAARLGRQLGLSMADVMTLEQGGLLHDLGKVGIRDELLLKPGALNRGERREFQRHPEIGVRMVENLRTMSHTLPVIEAHHERCDGSGYPHGLAHDAIPLIARVTAYADVYDALSSPRPYRAAFSHDMAMEILRRDTRKGLLDRTLLPAFEQVVQDRERELAAAS